MRIAIDARKLRDYGIGTYVRNLLRHLARLDTTTEYVLLCRRDDSGLAGKLGPNFRAVTEDAPKGRTVEQLSKAENDVILGLLALRAKAGAVLP